MKLEISEIAKRLNLNRDTVTRWIRQGKIPVVREGGKGIFNQADLIEWARKHQLFYRQPEEGGPDESDEKELILASSMRRGGVFCMGGVVKKNEALSAVTARVPGLTDEQKNSLVEQLIARENMSSTGIGKGVGIPHPRNPCPDLVEKPLIVTCLFEEGIDFDSIDRVPVFAVFLLLSPSTEKHLTMLARLSFCIRENSFVEYLKKKPEQADLIEQIEIKESDMDQKGF
jgi:PTS system nitrogen regulatory IIA component